MEYLIFAIALVLVLLVLMLKGYADYKRDEKQFIKRLYDEYGILPQKEYKAGQFENDLNMDEIFQEMNYTWSAAGEEYLYYLLRTPCMDKEELRQREKIIEYFRQKKEERVRFQFLFSKLGRCGKFSIYDYLDAGSFYLCFVCQHSVRPGSIGMYFGLQ